MTDPDGLPRRAAAPAPDLLAPAPDLFAPAPADLLIGGPERKTAQQALRKHAGAGRLDAEELERRLSASEEIRTQGELLRLFADLPAPHPRLPKRPGPGGADDEDDGLSDTEGVMFLLLLLGLPIAAVQGFAYGAWWALAVPLGLFLVVAAMRWVLRRAEELGRRTS